MRLDDTQARNFYLGLTATVGAIAKDLGLTLVPGMPVEAFIRTDDRTVVSYLMKPLNDQIMKASASVSRGQRVRRLNRLPPIFAVSPKSL